MASTGIPPPTPFENALYVGIVLQGVLYGIELVLYFKTMRIFIARRKTAHRSDAFYATFSSVMLLLVTVWVSILSGLGQKMWLQNRTYPGGPMAYVLTGNSSDVSWIIMPAVVILLQQMTDGLMIYRCRIVWDSLRVIIIPSFLWFAVFALGITSSIVTRTDSFSGTTAAISLAFYIASVLLNATLTSMICYRLLRHAKKVKECLGGEFASPYFTTVALIVESVLPYTLTTVIAILTSFTLKNQVGMAFSCLYTLMMCISPQMLILRVAEGNAWRTDTLTGPPSALRFSPGIRGSSGLGRSDGGGGTAMHLGTLPSVSYHPEPVEDSDKV